MKKSVLVFAWAALLIVGCVQDDEGLTKLPSLIRGNDIIMNLEVVDGADFNCPIEPPEIGVVLTWESTTHPPTDPAYRVRSFLGNGDSPCTYKIVAPTGNEPFSYNFKAGSGTSLGGYCGLWAVQMLQPSNHQPTTVTTSLGTFTSDGTEPGNYFVYDTDLPPGVSRTLTIPANPYSDRTLIFYVLLQPKYFNPIDPDCNIILDNRYEVASFEGLSPTYAIIEIPPRNFNPLHITGLHAWWKWNTDVTVVSDAVSQWNDQSGHNYHMIQNAGENRPAFDAATGKITSDGANDFLEATTAINDAFGEVTMVLELPTKSFNGSASIFSKNTSTGASDGDALNLWIGSTRTLKKSQALGTGQIQEGIDVIPTGQKVIVSWSRGATSCKMWINGVESTYSMGGAGNWSVSGNNSITRLMRIACNNNGCSNSPNISIYDVAWYNHELTSTERAQLTEYYKTIHNIP